MARVGVAGVLVIGRCGMGLQRADGGGLKDGCPLAGQDDEGALVVLPR